MSTKPKTITLMELADKFPDEESARKWFEDRIWPDGERWCPRCGCGNTRRATHRTMPYWCPDCRSYFSVTTGSVMESSKLPLRKGAWAVYLEVTSPKRLSSLQLERYIGVTQKTAWFMLHRIREAFAPSRSRFNGPVEIDETFVGGRERNKHRRKKQGIRGGTAGKTAVVGAVHRETNRTVAKVVENVDADTLTEFVDENVDPDATVYTDGSSAYRRRENHESVAHSRGEYVRGDCHTNGVESLWAILKRSKGIHHSVSPKHLQRYVTELCGRHNIRPLGTEDRMEAVAPPACPAGGCATGSWWRTRRGV